MVARMRDHSAQALIDLRHAAGEDAVTDEAATLALVSHDVFSRGATPLAVLRPDTVEALAAGIAAAARHGLAIVPRGGGMSYTGGYLADSPGAVLVDASRLDRVVAIDQANMTVTVEAGITWKALHEALSPLGLRVRSWGSLSGINATVGGGMSQNGTFWGSGSGALADSAIAFDVVLADGTVMSTGHSRFRAFGPDLTGLFCGDCGALGVKARATLRLVRIGAGKAYGSIAFPDAASFFAGMGAIAREGLASECFGFDPFLQAQRMKRDSLASDARNLLTMMRSQGSLLKGLVEGTKVAIAGRGFLDDVPFSLHCIAERRTQDAADSDMREILRIAAEAGGKPVENTIPKVLRANPFPPVNSMVGPAGERWVPVHGFIANDRLGECWAAICGLFESHGELMAREKIEWGALLAAVSPQCSLIEPVFYWPDALNPLHHAAVETAHMARLSPGGDNPAATEAVKLLRADLIALFRRFDAAHVQVARTYPLEASHDPAAWALLRAVKQQLDPDNRMNPGALGL